MSFKSFTVIVAIVATFSLLISTVLTVFFGLITSNPRSTILYTYYLNYI